MLIFFVEIFFFVVVVVVGGTRVARKEIMQETIWKVFFSEFGWGI